MPVEASSVSPDSFHSLARCLDTLDRPFLQTLPRLHFSEVVVVVVRGGQGEKGERERRETVVV